MAHSSKRSGYDWSRSIISRPAESKDHWLIGWNYGGYEKIVRIRAERAVEANL
jgi:hypothetical protein